MSYDEIVTLLVPYEDRRTLTLADAVYMVLQTEDRLKRIGATIVRDNSEEIRFMIARIFRDAQFQTESLPRPAIFNRPKLGRLKASAPTPAATVPKGSEPEFPG